MATAQKYRWDELVSDFPMPLLERQRIMGEKMMISRVTLHQDCFVPMHSHANEQISCVLSGKLRFEIVDSPDSSARLVEVAAGEVLVLPSEAPHSALALEETLVLDLFCPPSQTTGIDVRR
jgi:quercetin dioxygenase-like cupin family protein